MNPTQNGTSVLPVVLMDGRLGQWRTFLTADVQASSHPALRHSVAPVYRQSDSCLVLQRQLAQLLRGTSQNPRAKRRPIKGLSGVANDRSRATPQEPFQPAFHTRKTPNDIDLSAWRKGTAIRTGPMLQRSSLRCRLPKKPSELPCVTH